MRYVATHRPGLQSRHNPNVAFLNSEADQWRQTKEAHTLHDLRRGHRFSVSGTTLNGDLFNGFRNGSLFS